MNAEIEKQIDSIVEAAKSTGTDAVDFIKKQSPDYFSQRIKWYVWDGALSVLNGLFWCALSAVGGWLVLPMAWQWQSAGEKYNDRMIGFALCCAVVLGMSICSVLSVSVGGKKIIKAKVAPKVIIADDIKDAIKREESDEWC